MITYFDSHTHKIHNLAGPNDVVNRYKCVCVCVCEREREIVWEAHVGALCVWDDGLMKSCPGN